MRNFELIKTAIYREIVQDSNFGLHFLGGEFISMSKKTNEGKEKLNILLDRLDIRIVPKILKEHPNLKVPIWMKLNKYIIDYNKSGQLDLIRTS
jgi:hypothetical protein